MRSFAIGLAAAALLIGTPAGAKRYSDPVLGLSIEEPDGWHVVSASSMEHSELLPSDPKAKAAVQKFAPAPRFALVREQQTHDGVATSLTIGTAAADGSSSRSGARFLQKTLPLLDRFATDVKVSTHPETVTLAGKSSGHMAAAFTLKISGKSYSVAAETWAIPRDKDFIFVTAVYPADDDSADRAAARKIVNSIRLTS